MQNVKLASKMAGKIESAAEVGILGEIGGIQESVSDQGHEIDDEAMTEIGLVAGEMIGIGAIIAEG